MIAMVSLPLLPHRTGTPPSDRYQTVSTVVLVQLRKPHCMVMATVKRKIRWKIERMGTEEESDADMTRPKSEGRPNYCSPRCPTLIILSLLSPPTPFSPSLSLSQSHAIPIPIPIPSSTTHFILPAFAFPFN
ncbi:hypothetical protein VNO80_21015 [Phaseolus coccineus]|uniref:Uncharacterized protein n=1 Tax=Phaseolus coccineus TaxID=3886 RepID=A0AAN9M1M5_PHACN